MDPRIRIRIHPQNVMNPQLWSQDNTGEEDGDEGDGDDNEEEVDAEEVDDTECTCGSCTDDADVPKKCCNTSPCLSTTVQGMLIPH